MSAVQLRPYQAEALDKVDEARARGQTAGLLVAATGLGKTVMFSALAERWGVRTLILAHRDELVSQAAAKLAQVWPEVDVGIVKGPVNETGAHVVVASVQTVARPNRLEQLPAANTPDAFGLVVVDEAHHSAADSYLSILDRVGAGANSGAGGAPFLLGVTATPDRGDGARLDRVFGEIIANYPLVWGIRAGYLSDVRGLAVHLGKLDIGKIKTTAGDYQAGDAGRALMAAGSSAAIVDAWQARASDRRTLAFTATVAHAVELRDAYRAAGVRAEMVSGETPLEERREILARFAAGDVDVIANCAVLTEGYDGPFVDCIVIARPTKSRGLYAQMIGRGTRRHPGKTDCLVIDVVGASEDHSLVTAPSLFGVDETAARDGWESLSDAAAARDAEAIAAGEWTADDVDLFAAVRGRGVAWVAIHYPGSERRRYHCSLPPRDGERQPIVVLAQRQPDPADVWTAGLLMPDDRKVGLLVDAPLGLCQGVADDYVRRHSSGVGVTDARWRTNPPTEKQRSFAARWKIDVDPSWTAGDLSDEIERKIGRRRVRGARK